MKRGEHRASVSLSEQHQHPTPAKRKPRSHVRAVPIGEEHPRVVHALGVRARRLGRGLRDVALGHVDGAHRLAVDLHTDRSSRHPPCTRPGADSFNGAENRAFAWLTLSKSVLVVSVNTRDVLEVLTLTLRRATVADMAGQPKPPPKSLRYIHPAWRASVKRGERVRGHRHYDLVSVKVDVQASHVFVRTRDAWGYDAAEAEVAARNELGFGEVVWTYYVRKGVPEFVGAAMPGSGVSVQQDAIARAWVTRHVAAAFKAAQ